LGFCEALREGNSKKKRKTRKVALKNHKGKKFAFFEHQEGKRHRERLEVESEEGKVPTKRGGGVRGENAEILMQKKGEKVRGNDESVESPLTLRGGRATLKQQGGELSQKLKESRRRDQVRVPQWTKGFRIKRGKATDELGEKDKEKSGESLGNRLRGDVTIRRGLKFLPGLWKSQG